MESSSYEGVCDLIALTLKNMFTEWAPLFSTLVIRMKTHENHDSSLWSQVVTHAIYYHKNVWEK